MSLSERAVSGGLLEAYMFSVYTVAADWTTRPGKGDVIEGAGVEYRILNEVDYAQGTYFRWDVGAKYQE